MLFLETISASYSVNTSAWLPVGMAYLPQILQQSLDLLLCTKVLSSWTIHEGKMSTLTLRFKDVGSQLEGGALLENDSSTYKLMNRNQNKKARDSKRVAQHKIHSTHSGSQ